jgi:hypothetical protein
LPILRDRHSFRVFRSFKTPGKAVACGVNQNKGMKARTGTSLHFVKHRSFSQVVSVQMPVNGTGRIPVGGGKNDTPLGTVKFVGDIDLIPGTGIKKGKGRFIGDPLRRGKRLVIQVPSAVIPFFRRGEDKPAFFFYRFA